MYSSHLIALPFIFHFTHSLRQEDSSRLGQTSHRGDFSWTPTASGTADYRHRAVHSMTHNLKKSTRRKQASYRDRTPSEVVADVFNFDEWAPKRSTIAPPIPIIAGLDPSPATSIPSPISRDGISMGDNAKRSLASFMTKMAPTAVSPPNTLKTITKWLNNGKVVKKSRRGKKKRSKKLSKAFGPATVEADPVSLLAEVLKKERNALKKSLLIRKIEETRKEVHQLEGIERHKKEDMINMNSADTDRTPEEVANLIENEELVLKGKSESANQLKYSVKQGVLYKEDKQPVARLRKGLNIKQLSGKRRKIGTTRRKYQEKTRERQTRVASSPILLEEPRTPPQSRKIGDVITNGSASSDFVRIGRINPAWTSAPATVLAGVPSPLPVFNAVLNDTQEYTNRPYLAFGTTRPDEKRARAFAPPPIVEISDVINDIIDDQKIPPPYPFSHCYMNKDGFMCCNRYLESVMRKGYNRLKRRHGFQTCSVQKIAAHLQNICEQVFNTTIETIVGIDDFALRAHFAGDLMCKIQQDGRYITVYATAMPSRSGSSHDPLSTVTSMSLNTREDQFFEESNQLDGKVVQFTKDNPVRQKDTVVSGPRLPYHELSREDVENEELFSNDISA